MDATTLQKSSTTKKKKEKNTQKMMKSYIFFTIASLSLLCTHTTPMERPKKRREFRLRNWIDIKLENLRKEQKERIYTFLCCLKRKNKDIPGIYAKDIRQLFRQYLLALIEEEQEQTKKLLYQERLRYKWRRRHLYIEVEKWEREYKKRKREIKVDYYNAIFSNKTPRQLAQ